MKSFIHSGPCVSSASTPPWWCRVITANYFCMRLIVARAPAVGFGRGAFGGSAPGGGGSVPFVRGGPSPGASPPCGGRPRSPVAGAPPPVAGAPPPSSTFGGLRPPCGGRALRGRPRGARPPPGGVGGRRPPASGRGRRPPPEHKCSGRRRAGVTRRGDA